MIRAILMSFQPKWVELILNGLKTLELRSVLPKELKEKIEQGSGMWVYIYCTKAKSYIFINWENYITDNKPQGSFLNGKVLARFWVDGFITFPYTRDNYQVSLYELNKLCLTYEEVENYGKEKGLYALRIKNLEIFSEPMELSKFYRRIDGLDEDGGYILASSNESVTIPQLRKRYLVQKAPQSFMYVYVKEKDDE